MRGTDATFVDRADAGRRLAARLQHLRGPDLVVLGLPRGGVPVAFEVARALAAPLDVVIVRKLGLPRHPELAMGAIGEGGFEVLDPALVRRAGLTGEELAAVETRERAELTSRVARLRHGRAPLDLTGRLAVVVDDGVATGATARVACQVARHLGAAPVVLAVPVAPPAVRHGVPEADEVVVVETPARFVSVGHHYRDFEPTPEEQVVALLAAASARQGPGARS